MTQNYLANFNYLFINNDAEKTLFLFHGTGGNERDLLPLVMSLGDRYNFVGLRGNVSENGMNRFFERTALGVFNQESIQVETQKLANFLESWLAEHNLTTKQTAFIGYSNGANMILSLLFSFPELVSKAVLLHPMLPFIPQEKIALNDKSIVLTYGENDQIITTEESGKVSATLQQLGADVTIIKHSGGHQIQQNEVTALENFL